MKLEQNSWCSTLCWSRSNAGLCMHLGDLLLHLMRRNTTIVMLLDAGRPEESEKCRQGEERVQHGEKRE